MANCNDYISADDLKTGKQAILHIEHVAKSRDVAGNPALEVTDTIRGESVTNPTLDGFFSSVGFKPADGSFEDSGAINHRWEVLLYEAEGSYYQWMGALPKIVPVGSTPSTTGGVGPNAWVNQTDLTLRSDLTSPDGYTIVGVKNTNLKNVIFWGSPEMYGAKGDGVSDDTYAIQQCINNHAVTHLSNKLYGCAGSIELRNHKTIVGCGRENSILRRIGEYTNGSFVNVIAGGDGYEGGIYGVSINAAGLSDVALYLGRDVNEPGTTTITKGMFQDISVRNGKISQCVLDAVQNSKFLNVNFANTFDFNSKHGVYVINGAGNNSFDTCEMSGGDEGSVILTTDPSFPGYEINQYNNIPTDNTFISCMIECIGSEIVQTTRKRAINIITGITNRFYGCTIVTNGIYGNEVINLLGNASHNAFDRCSIAASPSFSESNNNLMIRNEGWCNRVYGGFVTGLNATFNQVYSNNRMVVEGLIHQETGLPAKVSGGNGLQMSTSNIVRYVDGSIDMIEPSGFGEIITNNKQYWISQSTSKNDLVSLFTGSENYKTDTVSANNGKISANIQLTKEGISSIKAVFRASDFSSTSMIELNAYWIKDQLNVVKLGDLATSSGAWSAPAATISMNGYITLELSVLGITSAIYSITAHTTLI